MFKRGISVLIGFFIFGISLIFSGCSKTGEALGIDIPEDNIIDETINESIWYPIRDQLCDLNFRVSGCDDNETNATNSTSSDTNSTCPDGQTFDTTTNKCVDVQCGDGFALKDGKCVVVAESGKFRDIRSKWFDILTEKQQKLVREDKNNLEPENSKLPVLTLLDEVPNGLLKMLADTRVVLPYYVASENTKDVLAVTQSSDNNVVIPRIIDSSNGNFKVIDTNSILFLELEAVGKVGDNASVSLKAQEEDATKYDQEDINVTIVENNHTYNPVSLFFTYDTIIIEEGDSRNIYFGISYTVDSKVKVLVRSDVEKIMSQLDQNKTLDLRSYEDNNILRANIVPNDNGVPFYFRLHAKGKAGDTMELFLVAIDEKGNYDYEKFNVLIVEKGKGEYQDVIIRDQNKSNYTPLEGDDYDKLTDLQKSLVDDDNNNVEPSSTDRPVITIFNPSPLKIAKGTSITTAKYEYPKEPLSMSKIETRTKYIQQSMMI